MLLLFWKILHQKSGTPNFDLNAGGVKYTCLLISIYLFLNELHKNLSGMLILKRIKMPKLSHEFVSNKSSEKYKPNNLAEYVTDSIPFLSYYKHLWVKTGYIWDLLGAIYILQYILYI